MLIGIDASRANKENKTGTEWYAYNVIQELKKIIPSQDRVVLYTKQPLRADLSKLPKNFSNRILKWPPKFLWTQLRLSWEMQWHRPDVLFVPAHTIPILCPRKTITTLHDVGFENFQNLYSKNPIGPDNKIIRFLYGIFFRILTLGKYRNNELDYHRWSAKLAVKKAAKIITISQFSIDQIHKYFPESRGKVVNVHNSYNINYKKIEDNKAIERVKSKYNLPSNYLFYIGRLEQKKNTPNLIKAFKIFKETDNQGFKLVLVGPDGFGAEEVDYLINKNNLKEDIIKLGWISNQDLPFLMNGANIFVFPSAYEGFGIPILEAMACGTPVITSNFGAMKEVADDAAVLVDSNNPEKISQAIIQLISNSELRKEKISLGFNRIKKFSWTITAQKIKELIYSL